MRGVEFYTLLLLLLLLWNFCSRCEGGHSSWGVSGLTMDVGMVSNDPGHGPHVKRAFRRALRRAARHGGTWYKNQWIRSEVLLTEEKTCEWRFLPRQKRRQGRRLKFFSWNSWSLTTELWTELQVFLQENQFDVALIQSTCWNFSGNWTSSGFHVMHSGDPQNKHCGVMTMVAQRLCDVKDLSVAELHPGRLLHVRLRRAHHSVDFLNVYQHPWRSICSKEQNLTQRGEIWEALDHSLQKVPFRNQLLLVGDFNATLRESLHPDDDVFVRIVQKHHLGSLQGARGGHTYFSEQGNSQIDYQLSRNCQMDSMAKQGHVFHTCPLASWRSGLDHRPLISSLPSEWMPWRRKPQHVMSATRQREHLRDMCRFCPDEWAELCQDLTRSLPTPVPDSNLLIEVHKTLCSGLQQLPVKSSARPGLPSGGPVKTLWELHRQCMKPTLVTCGNLLHLWQTWTRIQKLRRDLRKASRQEKRRKLEEKVMEAALAFRQKDPYKMYKVINSLAPKTPYKQVHLRSKHGLAQDPETELQELAQFFRDLCTSSEWHYVADPLKALPFSSDELVRALKKTPASKSVAAGTTPGIVIREVADTLGPWLFEVLATL